MPPMPKTRVPSPISDHCHYPTFSSTMALKVTYCVHVISKVHCGIPEGTVPWACAGGVARA